MKKLLYFLYLSLFVFKSSNKEDETLKKIIKKLKLYLIVFLGALGLFIAGCDDDNEDILVPTNEGSVNKKTIEKNNLKSFIDGEGFFILNEEVISFSFHASIDGEENIKGKWVEVNSEQDTISKGEIYCLLFYSENTAFVQGTVDVWNKETSGEIPINVYFKIVDNGVNGDPGIDEFSGYIFNEELNCKSTFTSTTEIDSGDVKIKTKGNFTLEEEADDDKTYVPDDNFEQALIDYGYDDVLDDYVLTNGIETIEVLHIAEKQISDLTGIEDFKDLTELVCRNNQLVSLDFSQNTALKILNLDNNQLTSLDISQNVSLESLRCESNQLTSLDISKNKALLELVCFINQLTSLDVSNNTALTHLDCGTNQLTSLDVSNNIALASRLDFTHNQIASIDVSKLNKLETLWCYDNRLTSLDVSQNFSLKELYATDNNISCIQINEAQIDIIFLNDRWTEDENTSYTLDIERGCENNILIDDDKDGVPDDVDECPDTHRGIFVDENGCEFHPDEDNDGVIDELDECPGTPEGTTVNNVGCEYAPVGDEDNDGVTDDLDECPNTPEGSTVDERGCEDIPVSDEDNDGVIDELDECPGTPEGTTVNNVGCEYAPVGDEDNDGVTDDLDECPNTPEGSTVDERGCEIR